ncbi:hypothetical protein BV25DRAFT_1919373 [Artomyces pyxidatus]|uniref:Uncharacterized protein n=1 Tax=Artomyces pyxidatus TaxID=48021 RepID=A0ACB8SR53_9AGAM|nr:hypothetical protein BV25DRAFT_1919373 [Artomyces pyxidatus]
MWQLPGTPHGVVIEGWPLLELVGPSNIALTADLKLLHDAVTAGQCKVVQLPPDDWEERKRTHAAAFGSSEPIDSDDDMTAAAVTSFNNLSGTRLNFNNNTGAKKKTSKPKKKKPRITPPPPPLPPSLLPARTTTPSGATSNVVTEAATSSSSFHMSADLTSSIGTESEMTTRTVLIPDPQDGSESQQGQHLDENTTSKKPGVDTSNGDSLTTSYTFPPVPHTFPPHVPQHMAHILNPVAPAHGTAKNSVGTQVHSTSDNDDLTVSGPLGLTLLWETQSAESHTMPSLLGDGGFINFPLDFDFSGLTPFVDNETG